MPHDTLTQGLAKRAIPEVFLESPREAKEHMVLERPLVFRGGVADWPAAGRWTPSFFARHHGDRRVSLYEFTRRDSLPALLADFVHYLQCGERVGALATTCMPLYLAWNAELLASTPELAADFDFRPLFGSRGHLHPALWMGGREAHTPLHTDIDSHNLHAVVHGEKHFLLYAPEDNHYLYPSDVYEWATTFSRIDVRDPDLDRFPLVRKVVGWEATLNKGDVLYIPPGWWHSATCMEPTISLNAWQFEPRLLLSGKLYADVARRILHGLGLHSRGRCTCHGHGDLRIHHGW